MAEAERNQIIWTKVEHSIKRLESDVLLIFDCCAAGALCSNRSPGLGWFEFLGSCLSGQTARSPGPNSFTNALIWALKELSEDPDAFHTGTLQSKIMECPGFKPVLQEQQPVLSYRHLPSGHIVIDRKSLSELEAASPSALTRKEKEAALIEQEYIDIRLHYNLRNIDEHVIDRTITALKHMRHDEGLNLSRIEYRGQNSRLAEMVEPWMRRARQRAASATTPTLPPEGFHHLARSESHNQILLTKLSPAQTWNQPATPAPSNQPSRAASRNRDDDEMSTDISWPQQGHGSLAYHLAEYIRLQFLVLIAY
jgi:hypothetical protein